MRCFAAFNVRPSITADCGFELFVYFPNLFVRFAIFLEVLRYYISCVVLDGVRKRRFVKTTAVRHSNRCVAVCSRFSTMFSTASIEACLDNTSKSANIPRSFCLSTV